MRWMHLFIIVLMNTAYAGEMWTTNDFNAIEESAYGLDENSLVLFDVDATLIVPDDAILKPKGKELFNHLIARCTERDLFRDIRMKAPHSLVDDRSIYFVQKLQERKIPVIALTAAPAKIRGHDQPGDWRVDELKRYGFDFSPAFPSLHFLELPKNAQQQYVPLFKSGVLYSSFHPKGDILTAFMQQLNLKPNRVLFVDDELGHVQSVVAALDEQGISCIGVHYTAANEAPCDLNVEQAHFQIDYFIEHDIWLGDQESRKFLLIKNVINK